MEPVSTIGAWRNTLRFGGMLPNMGWGVLVGAVPATAPAEKSAFRTHVMKAPAFPPMGDGRGLNDDMTCWPLVRPIKTGNVASFSIGRASSNEVILEHPSVSKLHARLLHDGTQMRIEDQESANGTSVGGRRLAPQEAVPIVNGTIVGVGQVFLTFFVSDTLLKFIKT